MFEDDVPFPKVGYVSSLEGSEFFPNLDLVNGFAPLKSSS